MTLSSLSAPAVFVFADIAGFTAMTEIHGDAQAAEAADAFVADIRPLLMEHDAELVKTIGDAVMLRVVDPAGAVALGVRIAFELMTGHLNPTVRIGMHYGPALARGGDWFGATVNLAARVAGEAAGGEVLLSQATQDAAGRVPGVATEALGMRRLRNIEEPVRLLRALPVDRAAQDLPADPVCHMAVDPAHCAGVLVHEEVRYHFCSMECVSRFARDPDRYAV